MARDTVDVCRQLTSLLDGAIGCYQTAAQPMDLTVVPVLVDELVEAAIARLADLADSFGVLVVKEGPAQLAANVDPTLVTAAIEQLIAQALRTSPPKGVVAVTYASHGANVLVAVSDQGPELSDTELRQLANLDIGEVSEGAVVTDLGTTLAQCRSLLIGQGGYADIESAAGHGTTRYMVVPAAAPREASETCADNPGIELAVREGDPIAPDSDRLSGADSRSSTMMIYSERFGEIEIETADLLHFPAGIIGFSGETDFVLVRKDDLGAVAWLQSIKTPYLALPVVSAHLLSSKFPDVPVERIAERAGLGSEPEELAVLVVVSAPPGQPATVNLMAPIVVNATTRVGAQLLVEETRFTTRELFVLPPTGAAVAPAEKIAAVNSAAE